MKMRVERLAENKVKIFISYEDLEKRGIDRDEMWQNGRKVQELFWDMMECAYAEVGFEVVGPISIEAFTMPTEGIIVIVTQVPSLPLGSVEDEEEQQDFEAVPEDVSESLASVVLVFQDFEDLLGAAHAVGQHADLTCTLYVHENKYYLVLHEDDMEEEWFDSVWMMLLEYATLSNVSKPYLEEYGKLVISEQPLLTLLRYFS
jgi:adapter protein MecA 1/2